MATCPCDGGEARVCQACVDAYSAEIATLRAQLAAVTAERDALAGRLEPWRAALVYYANEDGWTYTTVYQQSGYSSSTAHRAIDDDDVDEHGAGKRARAALKEQP